MAILVDIVKYNKNLLKITRKTFSQTSRYSLVCFALEIKYVVNFTILVQISIIFVVSNTRLLSLEEHSFFNI